MKKIANYEKSSIGPMPYLLNELELATKEELDALCENVSSASEYVKSNVKYESFKFALLQYVTEEYFVKYFSQYRNIDGYVGFCNCAGSGMWSEVEKAELISRVGNTFNFKLTMKDLELYDHFLNGDEFVKEDDCYYKIDVSLEYVNERLVVSKYNTEIILEGIYFLDNTDVSYEFYKDGSTHYAVSRSVISPKAYMKTFSSLDYAKQYIDSNTDTIKECGLWSIKQHTGRPRVSELEMKGIRVGQIITTLDLQIPYYQYIRFSDSVKNLFEGTIQNFQQTLNFVPNIAVLNTPEKAAAFIFLAHKQLKSKQDFFQMMKENNEIIQQIIKTINEAKPISYLVEKADKYSARTEYHLKLL